MLYLNKNQTDVVGKEITMRESIRGFAGSARPRYTSGVSFTPSGRVRGAGGGSGASGG